LLAVAAFPLATFAARGLAGVSHAGGGAVALVLAIDALVVAVALRLGRRPAPALGWILGAIVALLVADVATGARLQVASVLGYAPTGAGRFYGIGNGAFGVLGAATVLAAAGHLGRAPRRTDALAAVAALFGLVVVVDGAPTLGADGGGVVTLVPVLAVVLVALARHRVSWRVVAAGALGAVVVIALVVGVDLLRPAADRTHLGRTVADGTVFTTVARKASTNVRVLTHSVWAWMLPVAALLLGGLARRWRGAAHEVRVGAAGALAVAVLGYVVNDSGVVVAGPALALLCPFAAIAALERQRPAAVLAPAEAEQAGVTR